MKQNDGMHYYQIKQQINLYFFNFKTLSLI